MMMVSTEQPSAIRVLVADDFPALRRGIVNTLERSEGFTVIGEAGTSSETLERASATSPDVIVLDLGMPGVRGLELLQQLRVRQPGAAVLVFTMHAEDEVAIGCLKAGAAGFLEKQASTDEICAAVRTVAAGRRYLSPTLAEHIVNELPLREEPPAYTTLSDREIDVLQRIAEGQKPAEIASALGISSKTVQTYRARILDKLALRTTADLVRYAVENRLLGWKPNR